MGPVKDLHVSAYRSDHASAVAGRAGYTSGALDTDADSPTGVPGVYRQAGFVVDQRVVAYHLSLEM